MKKVYYVLKPSDFEFFSSVDREGEFNYERASDFNGLDSEDSLLFFEGKKFNLFGITFYGKTVKELVTGEKFKIQIIQPENANDRRTMNVYSKDLGTRTVEPKSFKRSVVSSNKIMGFMDYLKEDNLFDTYAQSCASYVKTAQECNQEFQRIANGPDGSLKRELRSSAKAIK